MRVQSLEWEMRCQHKLLRGGGGAIQGLGKIGGWEATWGLGGWEAIRG